MASGSHPRSRAEEQCQFPAFPYEPYNIQQRFMESLYHTLDKGGVGLFESPTGTGKTLSLICSVLQWLEDDQAALGATIADSLSADENLPTWLAVESPSPASKSKATAKLQHKTGANSQASTSSGKAGAHRAEVHGAKLHVLGSDCDLSDAEHLLEEWYSDSDEQPAGTHKLKRRPLQVQAASSDSDSGIDIMPMREQVTGRPKPKHRQVFFCSRTHSQLSQIVSELHRTPFADSIATVALASRKALCVNDAVLGLGSISRINERCLELKQGKPKKRAATAANNKPRGRSKAMASLQDALLAQPMDVEDLAKVGRRQKLCPYYTARSAIPEAHLVLLPYSTLLAQDSRESLQLHLEGSIIVVDEAHNLVDAVNAAHTAQLSLSQLDAAVAQLSNYFERFRTRLAAGNSRHIQSIITLAAALRGPLEDPLQLQPAQRGQQSIQTVNEFLFVSHLDGVNMFKLVRYAKQSKVMFKVAGYSDAMKVKLDRGQSQPQTSEKGDPGAVSGSHASALHALVGFMTALNNTDADGRILVDTTAGTLKFVLLNAAAHFAKVVQQAHAVVLASGTLSPIASLTRQLFPSTNPEAISHFSCGHVVPKERLLAIALAQGPSGARLDFRHERRGSNASLDEVGRLLLTICTCTPQGVVAFFPAFAHCEQLFTRWQHTGMLAQIAAKKKIFKEPRAANQVETMLQEYADCIVQATEWHTPPKAAPTAGSASSPAGLLGAAGAAVPGSTGKSAGMTTPAREAGLTNKAGSAGVTGGLMLCVVGGKLSEGINFSDGFGRCVVMVGMPYPNPADPELQERMRYMDAQQQQHALRPASPLHTSHPPDHSCAAELESMTHKRGLQAADLVSASISRALTAGLTDSSRTDTSAGKQYYEDLCLKAVNQCIGRVIRHRNDYAAVVLADARWAAGNGTYEAGNSCRPIGPLRKLPAWIQDSLVVCTTFGDGYGRLHRFHRQMRKASKLC